MNVRLLLKVVIPQPNSRISLNDPHAHWLCINLFSTRVTLVLFTASAMPMLSWKEQLTSLVFCVDRKTRAELLARRLP